MGMGTAIRSAIAFLVAWAVLVALLRSEKLPSDAPNPRSLHRNPIPRGGGIAIWCGVIAASCIDGAPPDWLLPLIAVIVLSWREDRAGVPVWIRLLVQVLAALAWVVPQGGGVWTAVLATLSLVWMANLYNFMDGSDGLAAAMSVLGFGALGAAGWISSGVWLRDPTLVAVATLPFLLHNLPPARVFLGDVGAVPLGFLAAVLGIGGVLDGRWPAWLPTLVFLPFIVDATVTLLRRLASGNNPLAAHRDHGYQRLVQAGLGHRGTLVVHAAMMVGCSASALAAFAWAPNRGLVVLALWATALLLMHAAIGYHWRKNKAPVETN
jgi:UDP-N-acetylmuramyl pentapeptide phosphotransferase/UDP-N-acetylglucosamine-1-phosphate transferase